MMLCCVLFSAAMLPVFAPLLSRMQNLAVFRGAQTAVRCCAARAGNEPSTRRLSVAWLIAGSGVLLIVGYVVLSAPAMAEETGAAPMSDAELWLEALHDAWCLPSR